MDLKSKLLDPAQTVLLYGTTPPRLGTPDEQVSAAAGKLAARLAARRRGGLRHPGRDRPHAAAAPVSLHAHHRSAPVLDAAHAKHPPAGDHLQGARHPG